MAEASLSIGGRSYRVICRDGGEAHLRAVAQLLDDKVAEARRAVGEMGEVRQLLLASLLVADELFELKRRPTMASERPELPPAVITAIENLADRIETFAADLESAAATA